jgi:6-phosphogluconolactonase
MVSHRVALTGNGKERRAINDQSVVYVGTYTRGESKGIYIYRLDLVSGALESAGVVSGLDNPSFLAIHPEQGHLYAVNEVRSFVGKPSGAVSAFAIDRGTGHLTLLNQQASVGSGPCHLTVDRTGKFVLVANYGSGSVCVLPIDGQGKLGEATDFVQHQGSSVNPRRQAGPHAHSITLDPTNRYAFAADLGLDKVLIYGLDLKRGKLIPHDQPWVQVKPGAGPRHFAFHPSGRYAYLITELDNTVIAFAYDSARGSLQEIQTVPALPASFQGASYAADLHVSPSGRFLYGSNRGHDSIAIFSVEEGSGRLTPVGHEPTQGRTPRGFALDPTGRLLLVANQDSNTVVTFRVDPDTGGLTATGHVAEVPTPVCLKLMTLPG